MSRRIANAAQALRVVRQCVRDESWLIDPHCRGRMRERGVTFEDLKHAMLNAKRAEAYQGNAWNGGEEWRVFGPDTERERMLGVGVEVIFREGAFTFVMTIFEEKKR